MRKLLERVHERMNLSNTKNFADEVVLCKNRSPHRKMILISLKKAIGLMAILMIGYHLDFGEGIGKNILLVLLAAGIWLLLK